MKTYGALVLFSGVLLGSPCLGVATAWAEEAPQDPLRAEFLSAVKQLSESAKLSPDEKQSREWFVEGCRSSFAIKVALRDFFSGDTDARSAVADSPAAKALAEGHVYVVEELRFGDQVALRALTNGAPQTTLMLPVWRKTQTHKVVVYQAAQNDRPAIESISAGLLGRNASGENRGLSSEGPYQRYTVTVVVEDDRARVTGCRQDSTFSSHKYVLDRTERRVTALLLTALNASPAERRRSLPKDCDQPFPGKQVAALLEPPLSLEARRTDGMPVWDGVAHFLVYERHMYDSVPERFVVDFTYRRQADVVQVSRCRRDEAFAVSAAERQRVMEFVRKYLTKGPEHRRSVLVHGGSTRLPEDGTISVSGRLSYANVTRTKDGTSWVFKCRIRHSGGFGKGWNRLARFRCTVRAGEKDELRIAEDEFVF